MKFGKKISSVANSSKALCPPEDWMNYKHLKKLLKDIQNNDAIALKSLASSAAAKAAEDRKDAPEDAGSNPKATKGAEDPKASAGDPAKTVSGSRTAGGNNPPVVKKRASSIVESKYEKIFFSQLKQELEKVTNTFEKLEQQLFIRFTEFLPKIDKLKKSFEQHFSLRYADNVSSVVEECAELHFLLVCLESYAVINYAGFTKILKKHDKVTGFATRDKYMMKLVDEKSFAQHKRIKGVLNAVTLAFGNLKSMLLKDKSGTNVYPAAYTMGSRPDKRASTFSKLLLKDPQLKGMKTEFPSPTKKRRVS